MSANYIHTNIFRQSGRTLADPVEDVACSDEKTREIQTMFQTCSHSTATSVYQTIQDITSVKIISHKLCKALTTIGTVCIKHLYQCFAEEDVKQMRKSHLEEMKTFLLRISEEKVSNNVFENCVVMEYVESEEQNGIVLPELDNNIVDMAVEGEEENEVEDTEYNEDADDISVQSVNTVKNDIESNRSYSIQATTEQFTTEQVKDARSVDYVETDSTLSTNTEESEKVTRLVNTDKKQSTEVYSELKQTSVVVDDRVDELVTDKVVIEKGVISPEEYTGGGCGAGRGNNVVAISAMASIITVRVIGMLW